MSNKLLISGLSLLAFLSSCVVSLYPITDNDKNVVFKKELLGHWKETENPVEYIIDKFTNSSDKIYRIQIIDKAAKQKATSDPNNFYSDTSHFIAKLVNLSGKYFLDCKVDAEHPAFMQIGEWTRSALLAPHIIIKIYSITQNSVVFASIDNDVFSELHKQKKISLQYRAIEDDRFVIIEKTDMLKTKLPAFDKSTHIFSNKITLIRLK